MDTLTEEELQIVSFFKEGFPADQATPPSGQTVMVITDHLNVYACRFESFLGNKIWEHDGVPLHIDEEVLFWKYLTN